MKFLIELDLPTRKIFLFPTQPSFSRSPVGVGPRETGESTVLQRPHHTHPGAAPPTFPPEPSNNHHPNTPTARNIQTHPPEPIDGVAADHVGRRKSCLFLCHAPPPWVDGRISPVEIASIDSRWRYTDPHFAHEPKETRVPPDWHCSRKSREQMPRIRFQFSKLAPCLLPLLSILESCTQK